MAEREIIIEAEWRAVVGSGGRYAVSSLGQVVEAWPGFPQWLHGDWTKPGWLPALVRQREGEYGHKRVTLFHVERRQPGPWYEYVHRLVVEAFVGPIPKGAHVNHIDGNPRNNHVSNLEIVTMSYNLEHARLLKAKLGGPVSGVYQLPSGRWSVRIRQDGLRQNRTFNTQDQAEAFALTALERRAGMRRAESDAQMLAT